MYLFIHFALVVVRSFWSNCVNLFVRSFVLSLFLPSVLLVFRYLCGFISLFRYFCRFVFLSVVMSVFLYLCIYLYMGSFSIYVVRFFPSFARSFFLNFVIVLVCFGIYLFSSLFI